MASDKQEKHGDQSLPSVVESGSDGKQKPLDGEVLPNITDSLVPEDRFVSAAKDVVSGNQRGLANQSSSRLVVSALEQKAFEIGELKSQLNQVREDLGTKTDEAAGLSANNAVLKERIRSLGSIRWVTNFIYVLATVLTGLATSQFPSLVSNTLFILAFLCIIIGLFAPLIFGRDGND